jgi:hypothetical protein
MARSVWQVETNDLNPRGSVPFRPLLDGIVRRFSFQKFPKAYEEMDEQKGVSFESGFINGVTVERLQIFNTGLVLDTRTSTDASDTILEESLLWAAEEFGLNYQPGIIRRKHYVSQLTFYSDVPLLRALNPVLEKLSNRVTAAVSGLAGEDISYEPSSFHIQHDMLTRKYSVASFTVQRRADTPFRESKYFSEAPLQTSLHETLLAELEADILSFQARINFRA